MGAKRLLGAGDRCSNPPARGVQAQRGAAEQYGTQQGEQQAGAEQLLLRLSPAAHGDVHVEEP